MLIMLRDSNWTRYTQERERDFVTFDGLRELQLLNYICICECSKSCNNTGFDNDYLNNFLKPITKQLLGNKTNNSVE